MKKDFSLVWSFRNRFDVLKKSIETADATCPKFVKFTLIDANSSDETIIQLREFCNTIKDRKIRIAESNYRSTLAEAWNLGIMLSDTRYVIFSSSDVEFLNDNWFFQLANAANCGGEYILLENHAVFLFDKKMLLNGNMWFDENYKLGPHFDVDEMIKVSEYNFKLIIIKNNNYYKHGEEREIENLRINKDFDDRLTMSDKFNEKYFKSKWESNWEGWQNLVHPPTHISQVKRIFEEIDPHPLYTKKYTELYGEKSANKTSFIRT
jgi:glycosyltransferase involved in cell wall biosynthesis